ncbi:MAG TPA: hypothetical protein VG325_01650 [Solirubrobacteraceae bacterium]|nr:hypothetical protein [Solirubrobacteraceae bacterium]
MTRTLALLTIVAAIWMAVSAPPAHAFSPSGAICSLTGLVSTWASKACDVASHPGRVIGAGKQLLGGHLGGALDALTGAAGKTAAATVGLAAIATAAVGGARYLLQATAKVIGATTRPNLTSTWFSAAYWRMAAVSALLTLPFLFAAAVQAMIRSDLALLARAAFGYLPLALLAVGVAAPLTMLLLAGSDEMSSLVSAASGQAGAAFLDRAMGVGGAATLISRSVFVAFFMALLTAGVTISLWVELVIRSAAVYVIVLMLPLFFAAMVWPARRIWAARAVEVLVSLILSKFAIVAVLALGGAALGHADFPGPAAMLTGATLVMLAALSPWALMRLLPLHEIAGAAAGGLRAGGGRGLMTTAERADAAANVAGDLAGDLPRRLRLLAESRLDEITPGDAPPVNARPPEPVDLAPGAGDGPQGAGDSAPSADAAPAADAALPDIPSTGRADERSPMPEVLRAPSNGWRPMDLGAGEFRSDQPLLEPEEEADPPPPAGPPPPPADRPPPADPQPPPPSADPPPLPPPEDRP